MRLTELEMDRADWGVACLLREHKARWGATIPAIAQAMGVSRDRVRKALRGVPPAWLGRWTPHAIKDWTLGMAAACFGQYGGSLADRWPTR